MKALAATQHPSSMVIGRTIRSKLALRKLWEPVQRKALWEMQTWLPIDTGARLRIITSSPIQTWSPIVRFQGKVMFTRDRITTPLPIRAPNNLSDKTFKSDGTGNQGAKRRERTNHQIISLKDETPR
jgi:hypothetical protein